LRRAASRSALVAAAVLVALGIAAAAFWFWWLPGYRPTLAKGESYGVDVSAYQGRIDWTRVAEDHIRFAYIKADEGVTLVDRDFARNWAGAASAGVRRGAYQFFSLCDPGITQAQSFLRTVPRDAGALPPAVDLELAGNCRSRPSVAVVGAQLSAFLRAVQRATGHAVVLYLGTDFAHRYSLGLERDHPLWLYRPLRPPAGARWVVWQVDGRAHVSGIDGHVDLDVGRQPLFYPDR
jgi:lysozyme